MDLLAERLAAIGVGRRDFLKVAAGSPRWRRRLQPRPVEAPAQAGAGREARQGAAPPHRRRRLVPERPVQPRLQQGPLLLGGAGAVGRPHEVRRELPAGALRGGKVDVNAEGSVWTFRSARTRSGRTAPRARPRTSSGRGSGRWTRRRGALRSFFYDIKGAEPFNKGKVPDTSAWACGQGRLDARGDARRPARLFPGALRVPGRAAGHPRGSRSTATGGRRRRTSCATGRSRSRTGARQEWCSGRTPTSSAPGRDARPGDDPHHSRGLRALPYENNDVNLTPCRPAISRGSSGGRPASKSSAIRSPALVLVPQVTKAPFDNVKVRRAVGQAIDARRRAGRGPVRRPRPLDDPARLPGRDENEKIAPSRRTTRRRPSMAI